MFDYIKYFLQKFQSSKFIRKGKCNGCGSCCRNILLYTVDDEPIKTEEQFKKVQEFDKHFYNFYISGKAENGSLLFTCRELSENNRCKVYFFRGLGCRQYPKLNKKFLINGGKPLDGCGYYFEPTKKFNDFLK